MLNLHSFFYSCKAFNTQNVLLKIMFSTDLTGNNNTVGLLGFDPLYGKDLICALYLCTYNNVCLTKVRTYAIFVNNILTYQRHFVGSFFTVKVVSFNSWETSVDGNKLHIAWSNLILYSL